MTMETPTATEQLTDVLQVTTSPAPDNGVLLAPTPAANANVTDQGVGTEGEESIWIGRYSYKNYTLRFLLRIAATIGWLAMLVLANGSSNVQGDSGWTWLVPVAGVALGLYWLLLFWQVMTGRIGHRYELTNRRLFIDTGWMHRRRDQMELLKIQDIYVKQTNPLARILDVGTVVIESSENRLPIHYMAGVDQPNVLMDQIWHQARKERDLRSVKVDQV